MRLSLLRPSEQPDLIGLPWAERLETWPDEVVAGKPGGMHRHTVRYLNRDGQLYVLKELPSALAAREFRLLRHLAEEGLPCVEVVGVVSGRGDDTHGEDVLISRYLDFSLPYRVLLTERRMPYLTERVLDALASLLVRLHLNGFWWGDCSLSNTLFRRDAGALSAYVVDTETGELHDELSDGQRDLDLSIATENIAGGLADLVASGRVGDDLDPFAAIERIEHGYAALWAELTGTETFRPDETFRVRERIVRLNQLGFDVEEMEVVSDGVDHRVKLTPRVVELGFHRQRLASLTGIEAEENQARVLLNDIAEYGAVFERPNGKRPPEGVMAARWLDRIFEPTLAKIPQELRGKLVDAELYHQLLEHRWFLSERAGRDVGTEAALRSFVSDVLAAAPDERFRATADTMEIPVVQLAAWGLTDDGADVVAEVPSSTDA
jgi:tRNA A-37 threonylcarbamoyl transferase component Bud32